MWKSLNEILYNKTEHNNTIKSIAEIDNNCEIINTKIHTDNKQIANILNSYFGNIGRKLFEHIEEVNSDYLNEISINQNSLYLRETTVLEIKQKIESLKPSNSINDNISSNMLKMNSTKLAPIISELINKCISEGSFPNSLKISRIVPIYKDGNPLDPANYRPINILSPLSKIFEMVLYDRIIKFINKFKLIDNGQYGFQEKSGTLSASMNVIFHIQNALDSKLKKTVGCVFIDLRKAFDTVPHNILIQKLNKNGIRGNALNIIKDYFRNRTHYTDINNIHSVK